MRIDQRSLVIPSRGNKLIIADQSQIEARVLRWIAKDYKTLDAVRDGYSIYEAAARAEGAWVKDSKLSESKDPKDKLLYKYYKTRELGCGYGCGHEKFLKFSLTNYNVNPLDIVPSNQIELIRNSLKDLKAIFRRYDKKVCYADFAGLVGHEKDQLFAAYWIVKDYRERNYKIVNLWERLDKDLKATLKSTLRRPVDYELELPSGRSLIYYNVRTASKKTDTDDVKNSFGRLAATVERTGGLERPKFLYGGILTENLVQATARDVFGFSMLNLWKAGHEILFHVHDEVVLNVPKSVTKEEIAALMQISPSWADGLPLDASVEEAEFYKK